ncbi:MAG: NAD-dependent epimerase/dehydratase family protein, partial [Chitinophagaceae bacterium]
MPCARCRITTSWPCCTWRPDAFAYIWPMRPVLITGANGFVGNYLSEYLASSMSVLATGKGDCRFFVDAPALAYAPLDITDPGAVDALIDRWQPRSIVHCAALSKP